MEENHQEHDGAQKAVQWESCILSHVFVPIRKKKGRCIAQKREVQEGENRRERACK